MDANEFVLPGRIEGADEQLEFAPLVQTMNQREVREAWDRSKHNMEDTPAYATLVEANLITTEFRIDSFGDIFGVKDFKANSSKSNDLKQKCVHGYFCCPVIGCVIYWCTHTEMFIPAGHIGCLMDEMNQYLFAQPGMHNIPDGWMDIVAIKAVPTSNCLVHGNRHVLVVEQGFIGLAFDNGQPVLFPPGIHVWTSDTLWYKEAISLDQHVIHLGPYTLVTVDEGYAAVTQNNGMQCILPGGMTHLLEHKNWRFEKFLTLKIQTDDLEEIEATSADNVVMQVTSTVLWKVCDPTLAATMGAETMVVGHKKAYSSNINKLRGDVLKQAIASLACFIGGVNYSDSFHMAAKAQGQFGSRSGSAEPSLSQPALEPESEEGRLIVDNPLYDESRMTRAVDLANLTTRTYGVEILSINIVSAVPVDAQLTNALACGAVASATALQAETSARGNANAMRVSAEATALKACISAEGCAQAALIRARAEGDATRLIAEGNKSAADVLATSEVAVDLAKMDKSATLLRKSDKFFFGQEPAYLANLMLKDDMAH